MLHELLDDHVQEPFAMRNLVPAWVSAGVTGSCERYYEQDETREERQFEGGRWVCAAAWLRKALAHASLWLPHAHAYATPREDRLLTTAEVQSMLAHFKTSIFDDGTGRFMAEPYLRWFEEDDKLARRVSDAWNAVVKRGEAGSVECECAKCKARILEGQWM